MTGTVANLNLAPQIKRLAVFLVAAGAIAASPFFAMLDLPASLDRAASVAAQAQAAKVSPPIAPADRISAVWDLQERISTETARVPVRPSSQVRILIASR